MPLRPPILDDRRYEDLVAELVSRIPAHTPEWTHPQAGDPGRTLIELFAWLGDALLYRVNLIPERQRLAFLRLLGQSLRPARAARGLVTIRLKDTEVPERFDWNTPARFNGPSNLVFEAADEISVLPVNGACWVKRPASIDPVLEAALADFHRDQIPHATAGVTASSIAPYVAETLFVDEVPESGGFDLVTQTADRCLWIALLAAKAGDAGTDEGQRRQAVRNGVVADLLGNALLNVGVVPALPAGDALEPATRRARVPHRWEIAANLSGQRPGRGQPWRPEYLRLDEVADSTGGLTRPGVVRLALPARGFIHAPTSDVREDPSAGVGDRPPRIDDESVAARVVAWIRLRPENPGAELAAADAGRFSEGDRPITGVGLTREFAAPATGDLAVVAESTTVSHLPVAWAGLNAVEVRQLTTIERVVIGESNGAPDLELALPLPSVEPETLVIEVEEAGAWRAWSRVEDLQTFAEDPEVLRRAAVYTLDAEAGVVRFGDDVRGRIPPVESRIRVRQMRSGGGAAGNIAARTLKSVSATVGGGTEVGSKFLVVQPLTFEGGAEAETLAEAERRIPARLRHRERAVTGDDYAALARETPGVSVGRVELLPRFKPQQRFFNVPGVVSVLALPERPFGPAPNPRADRPFLEAIHGWLDARRPLGTELYVIGCEYVPVSVSVAVTVREGFAPTATLQAVKEAVRRLLWPLAGGGFDGRGWTLGRALSNRELAVEVSRVPGVSEVAGLNLFRRQAAVAGSGRGPTWVALGDSATGVEQNLALEPYQLPELLHIHAVADDTARGAPLSLGTDDRNLFAAPNAVAVPVVPRLC